MFFKIGKWKLINVCWFPDVGNVYKVMIYMALYIFCVFLEKAAVKLVSHHFFLEKVADFRGFKLMNIREQQRGRCCFIVVLGDMPKNRKLLFDGSEIRRSPVEVGSLSIYLQGFSTIQTVGKLAGFLVAINTTNSFFSGTWKATTSQPVAVSLDLSSKPRARVAAWEANSCFWKGYFLFDPQL